MPIPDDTAFYSQIIVRFFE